MKIGADTREVLKGNVGAESAFTIRATSRAFQILSSGLYSNKILAIIRELSCNAYDAHVAAGKRDVPIEIYLPTALKPVFSVKDFGIGLDHEGVTQLYTTYFESTKQDSNDFIGALGLGSKSPFSYTNSFNVEARFDGMKRMYTAFINEHGLPSIATMNEEPTDEVNGLTISLAVKNNDIDSFHHEAKRALMYFNPKPNVKGAGNFEPYPVKHSVVGLNWKVRESDNHAWLTGPFIIQGFVAYPVDADQIQQVDNISEMASAVLGIDLDITVPMGDVEVAASREALSYDARTIKNLVSHLEAIATNIHSTIQAEYDRCGTYWEACCKSATYTKQSNYTFHKIYDELARRAPFTWNGKTVGATISLPFSDIRKTSIIRMNNGTFRKQKFQVTARIVPGQKEQVVYIPVATNTLVVVDDIARGTTAIIDEYLNVLYPGKRMAAPSVLILSPIDKKDYDQAEIDLLINRLGNLPVVLASSMPGIDSSNKTKYAKRDSQKRLVWGAFPESNDSRRDRVRRTFSRLCWKAVNVDLSTGGFYVPLERFTIMHGVRVCSMFDRVLAFAEGVFNTKFPEVYGFNAKEIALVEGNSKWVNLFRHLEEEFVKLNMGDRVIDVVVASDVIEDLHLSVLINRWSEIRDELTDGPFKAIMTTLHTATQQPTTCKEDDVVGFLNSTADADTIAKIADKKDLLLKNWQKVVDEYEMLKLVDFYRYKHHLTVTLQSTLINYINMVSAKA